VSDAGGGASSGTSASAGGGGVMAPPFYCPYCGEQDLRPGETAGTWHCLICTRTWSLKFLSTGEPDPGTRP